MIYGLAYSSRGLESFDDESLLELADNAASNNEKLGVTGYLFYRDELFMQYLEGEQAAVKDLMSRISKDSRHKILSTISLPSCPERVFPHWYMRFLGTDLPTSNAPTLEDELAFILDTTSQGNYESGEVADAILHVTRRIALLDW